MTDNEGFDGALLAKLGSKLRKTRGASVADRLEVERRELAKIDGRSMRKTGRTEQFNVRLRADTKEAIHRLAKSQDVMIAEVIEQAVEQLERTLGQKR